MTFVGSLLVLLMAGSSAYAQETETGTGTETELAALIKRAQRNPLSAAARQRTLAATAKIDEVVGKRWASFEARAFLAPSPRIECDNLDCTRTSPQNVTVNIAGVFTGAELNITQPLYTFGKIHYAARAARAGRKASAALEDDVAGEAASLVAEAYYGYLLAQELLWMLEEGLEHIESGRKTLDRKLEEGAPDASVQDRFRIQSLQSEVRLRIADATHGRDVALASLRVLVGDPDEKVEGSFLEAISFDLPDKPTSADVDPKVRAARFGVQAQTALETFEKRNYLPDLAIVGGFRVARAQGVDDAPGAFANDPFNFSSVYVALAARWNLEPWVQAARTRQQTAVKLEAIATAEAAERLANLEQSRARANAVQARDRLAALSDGERAGKAWVASVVQADAIGAASARDLADAYLAYFSARAQLLDSTYRWNLAVIELQRQAGEFSLDL